ncbi:hypothetical protein LAZ67_10003679 [Cordylochernes scorpioides]|uniref:Transposase n=1 Tax=Cordylochernes scorpioides TaxID=51811 RepID=A0ABY6L015_9ARAC|nr:hypothetical protein LAZ67_10003679 [Cordylochernes scorpioides]
MEQKLKQRICIEICVKLQISATETFKMPNKALPNDPPKRTTMILGKNAQNVQKITDLIKENPRTTLLELEQDTGISKTTIGRIVTKDLKLKKTPAKFIPRFLTNEQKLCRLATCENMLEMTRTDPEWKDKIITGDETWVYDYDPETKRQYAEWRGQGEPRPKKSRILKSRNKVLLVAFLDNKGIVHHEYLPAGQTVIKEMYLDILRHLREAIRKKMPEKWPNEILPQPPYSPDIAPNDFFLFPKLKAVLKGRHFDTRDDIIEKSLLALKSIPKELYKNCFDNLGKRWRCNDERKNKNKTLGRTPPIKSLPSSKNLDGNCCHTHPPYSPDVAPSDFHLFPELKKNLGGTQFQDDDELEEAVLSFLRGQAAEFFDSGLHKWVSRMQKCVKRNGEYVEK